MLLSKIRQRLAKEEGFTLIELLVVLVIIGVLLAIAVPSYLGFKDRAANTAAQSNIRASVPAMEACYSDRAPNSYVGCTAALLKASYDSGLKASGDHMIVVSGQTASSYTICSQGQSGRYYRKNGPGADITFNTTAC